MSLYFFITETGYEGNGTVNESGSDRLHIYIRHIEEGTEYDIDDLGIEGQWINSSLSLPSSYDFPDLTFQLVIEVRCNASNKAFFFTTFNLMEV